MHAAAPHDVDDEDKQQVASHAANCDDGISRLD